ncbi:MAG: iron chelate uptake ABC transporter family permease subunit [Candidatus Latescibacterota bacterium]|nr:iron chelate uptake ABC transporter family permease subunit [Candidatus Latescibacterota bacterium]
MNSPFWDLNFQMVLLGSLLIGATGGLLGTFAVLRKRSLMGDALAHAALPGVAGAFLLTGSKTLPVLIAGATATGVLGVLMIQFIVTQTRVKADAALGIVLSVFFGAGIVLLTHIQQSGVGNQSGLDKFLFGQAASIVGSDVKVMCVLAAFVMLAVVAFYKEFKALIFDPDYLASVGYNARLIDLLLMGLIVLTVMVGLQAVGVILIAAMLITPAVSARFWTEKLGTMVTVSACLGAISGSVGTWISTLAPKIPTGPVMVLVATGCFLISAIFAPSRGVIARLIRLQQNRNRESRLHFLRAFSELVEIGGPSEAPTIERISKHLSEEISVTSRTAKRLARGGWLDLDGREVSLTEQGLRDAEFVLKSHRLWEHYLVHRSNIKLDHVDRPADEVEHILTPDIVEALEKTLKEAKIDTASPQSVHATSSKGLMP